MATRKPLSKLEQARVAPRLEDFDFTRPHIERCVDLCTAVGLLIGYGIGECSYIERADDATRLSWWYPEQNGNLGESWRTWLRMRYELQRRDMSPERRFYPCLLDVKHAVIWYRDDEWEMIPAYGILRLF